MNRDDVEYVGVFTDKSLGGCLHREIANQHITLSYLPDAEKFDSLIKHVGTRQAFEVLGYGNDGLNEGLLVRLKSPIPYYGAEAQHVTLSVAADGKPVNTAFLQFDKPIPSEYGISVGDVIYGQVAVFTKSRELAFDPTMFEEYYQHDLHQGHDMEEFKQKLQEIATKKNYHSLCPDEINLDTMHFRVNGGEWQALSRDDWSKIQRFLNDPDCKVDISMQCFDALVDSSFFPIIMQNVEQAGLVDGHVIVISEGFVLSDIDFVGKEAIYQTQGEHDAQNFGDIISANNAQENNDDISRDDGLVR